MMMMLWKARAVPVGACPGDRYGSRIDLAGDLKISSVLLLKLYSN